MDVRDKVRRFLERAGATDIRATREGWECRCFFHEHFHSSRGRTLGVNVEKGVFCCQSAVCGRSGPILTILVERCGVTYKTAREFQDSIATRDFSIDAIPAWDARGKPTATTTYLDPAVLGMFDRCPRYMLGRGFSKATLRQWDIGYDQDAERVTIPVWTRAGKLLGISTRTIHPDTLPIYMHPFPKGEVLYGEHRLDDVTAKHPLVVVEGQVSVLWMAQHGIPNVVATMGAQVAVTHMEMMAKFPHVVLAFDDPVEDAAGRMATLRVGRYLAPRLGRGCLSVVMGYESGRKDPADTTDPTILLIPGSVWSWEKYLTWCVRGMTAGQVRSIKTRPSQKGRKRATNG